ncbi:N-6 DNA methylase [Streptomyces sp. NP-1717]|uniref:N-6 DNA methylase n=1 Tax=Streptomyces sp. NP-1717 TaxID=2704470 RepID=UPI001F5DCE8C|nr:N-6 DNA methylase [Streptomyces sp. NP-1717]MCI3224354.1 SAM-dependent DNA methyltransferase [Streptomyces sp. NP-1717]
MTLSVPTSPTALETVLKRVVERKATRAEATLQADIRQFLLDADLNLGEQDLLTPVLEAQVGDGTGHRIDIEMGATIIEVKKDISRPKPRKDGVEQLAKYVRARTEQRERRHVGILTDGADWRAYTLVRDELNEVNRFDARERNVKALDLVRWLEGVLATSEGAAPTPDAIATRLGADSVAHSIDKTILTALYEENKNQPTVQLKRDLWARLLRSALGAQFDNSDELFIEHTLLVNTASIIAHAVMGIDVKDTAPASLVNGQLFTQARISGVVESDFFGWPLETEGGEGFVQDLARRLAGFDWSRVDHDVLKVLYESVITTETRKKQGEYYTPDWLAEATVMEAVPDPLNQRIMDPSCGSGTFLFHGVRRYLAAARGAGLPLPEALDRLHDHVAGIDLHPVAVALARVTYLLAIGRETLTSERGPISVPVYLGDSLQWDQRTDLIDHGHLVIKTGTGNQLFANELRFSEALLQDPNRFDAIVNELADKAADPHRAKGKLASLAAVFNRHGVADTDEREDLTENFRVLCELVDEDRNHIWSYYVRNLARPMWLSRAENRVDVLVGNPPWLSYRHMPEDMQKTFKTMMQARGLWKGFEVATHQDLSGLFIARAVQQYLRVDGSFAFVVPNPVLDRPYWTGFRTGDWTDPDHPVKVDFTGSWDLRRLRPHFFPRAAAVIFGRRRPLSIGQQSNNAVPLPRETEIWAGKIPKKAVHWERAKGWITRKAGELRYPKEGLINSPYQNRFAQGATVVPKVLFFVKEQATGPLGLGGGRVSIRSQRSTLEKKPWKDLPDLEGSVEKQFVRPVLLGEHVVPYRILGADKAVLPIEGTNTLMHGEHDHLDRYPDLAMWWRNAERLWADHRSSDRLSLIQQLNFRKKLTEQLPGAPLRVVYGASGMYVTAALVDDPNAVIEHKLYWGTVATRQEGTYLLAVLNSPYTTEVVRPLMSYGKDERDIDKAVWELPIPDFDPSDAKHARIAEIGEAESQRIAELKFEGGKSYIQIRRTLRDFLLSSPDAEELDQLVTELLG